MKIELRHDLPRTPDQYWDVFFDPEANERMYREALGCTEVVVEAQEGDRDTALTRTLRSTMPIDAPGPVKKLMGDENVSIETGTLEDGVWSFEIRPDRMADKITMRGTTRVEATDEGCVRIFELDGKVKILGVGKVIEGFMEKQAREAQDATAEWNRSHFG